MSKENTSTCKTSGRVQRPIQYIDMSRARNGFLLDGASPILLLSYFDSVPERRGLG